MTPNNNNGTNHISPLPSREGQGVGLGGSAIQLLPDSVANQIAAGEVIQRPASVIKELVENAVDAGATRIDVIVVDAGKTSIQVIDNGCGMSITDARLSFERHATSKIRKAEDLFSLHTMGFRGEALPSIAAVAQVKLTTRRSDDELGTELQIAGSRFVSQQPVASPTGSNFLIENLFFNVPVRRRFLKSNATEMTNIVTAFQRIVLVYPEITFTLHSNGQEVMTLRAGSLHQRIIDVFGRKINQLLLPVEVETTLCKIKGFVGKPESAHKKGVQQYFFVNGRFMKHPYFQKAVISSFDRLIPTGEQVPFFIYFEMNPEEIDVNIHPTKTEIKFQNEQAVWQILSAAIRDAVGNFCSVPTIDFDTEGRPEMPSTNSQGDIISPTINFDPQYNPFATTKEQGRSSSGSNDTLRMHEEPTPIAHVHDFQRTAVPSNWESLYEGLTDGTTPPQQASLQPDLFDTSALAQGTPLTTGTSLTEGTHLATGTPIHDGAFQYQGSYIISNVNGGLLVVDQERAHERVLYEDYLSRMENKKKSSQKNLFPELVQFTLAEMVVLPIILPEIESLGFELTDMGSGSYAINAYPADLDSVNITRLVSDMVASAADDPDISSGKATETVTKAIYASLAASMARNAAIPHGQVLSHDEMESILSRLFQCSNSRYTPNGKPIYKILPHEQIVL